MSIKYCLGVDFETYYDRDGCSLRQLTVPEYIFHPKFAVHLLAVYDIRWPAPRYLNSDEIPSFLEQYPAQETMAFAHNMLFDGPVLAWKYGWVPGRLTDTLGMVRTLRNYRNNSLDAAAKELFGHSSKGDVIRKVAGLNIQGIKTVGLWPDYCRML